VFVFLIRKNIQHEFRVRSNQTFAPIMNAGEMLFVMSLDHPGNNCGEYVSQMGSERKNPEQNSKTKQL